MSDVNLIWLLALIAIAVVWWCVTGKSRDNPSGRPMGGIGSAAAGTLYEMLNDERRKAVEVIVEERAGERDPEDRDGNLPDLAGPTSRSR